jgi:AcrR family transcriptional regulator
MQRPNEEKRQRIADTAARLFASRPFHKVRLDDVAAAAGVGKGTVYIYYKSKEDLYASLVSADFRALVHGIRADVNGHTPPDAALAEIIDRLVTFSFEHPTYFEVMPTTAGTPGHRSMVKLRAELTDHIARTLRRGVRDGLWSDPNPALTATLIPGLMRSAILYGPPNLTPRALTTHLLRLLHQGLGATEVAR